MTKSKRLMASLLAVTLLCSPSALLAHSDPTDMTSHKTIIAAGSGVNLGITKLLAAAFMATTHGFIINVPGSIGTKGAITAVKDDAIALGLISRDLKPEEQSPDYTAQPYAMTPIVVAVNNSVPDEDISSQDITNIYKGTKTNWKDGSEIVVLSRESYDSGFMVLEKNIPGFKEACNESRKQNRWTVNFTDQEANRALSTTPHAIGVTDLGMISTEQLAVKSLKLNGVTPSVETAQNGQYPLTRTLFLLYRNKTLSPEAKAFVDFIRSDEGASILKANGYLPL